MYTIYTIYSVTLEGLTEKGNSYLHIKGVASGKYQPICLDY